MCMLPSHNCRAFRSLCAGHENVSLLIGLTDFVRPVVLGTHSVGAKVERLDSDSQVRTDVLIDSVRIVRLGARVIPNEEPRRLKMW